MQAKTIGIKEQVLSTGRAEILSEQEHLLIVKWTFQDGLVQYSIEARMHGPNDRENNDLWSAEISKEKAMYFCEYKEAALQFLRDNHSWYREHI